jgi:predicted ATP-grasp superfamily ATP-dependent carboligase
VKALVTGAEEHQGLAVIRGLGLAGIPVVAGGAQAHSLGFYSRFAGERFRYTSPFENADRFADDVLAAVRRTRPDVVIPTVESTLVALDRRRQELEALCVLAAPPSDILDVAIDKLKTIDLAREVGVPVPQTVQGQDLATLLAAARQLRFPVAIKPRGHALHESTRHGLQFKVRYADDMDALRVLLESLELQRGPLLIQEYLGGSAVCVSAVYDHGRPVVRFPYARDREWPLTGGISVVRRSLPPVPQLDRYVDLLLDRMKWHGVAMVEFKHDPRDDTYALMEINGRFQASMALCLDAGLNLPELVYRLHTGGRADVPPAYRVGVRERWLRGDWLSLLDYVLGDTIAAATRVGRTDLPSRWVVMAGFLAAFHPGMHYDEFKLRDWKPGLVEALEIGRLTRQRLESIAALRQRAGQRRL